MLKTFFASILSLFIFCQPLTAYKYDLSICMIFQNDAPYLKEWIEFHRLVGAQHFFLYNNLSTDHYLEVLTPYVEEGIVELIDWPYPSGIMKEFFDVQDAAYQDAINRTTGESKWLAIIDSDEFLFPVKKDNLVDFLSKYEKKSHIGGLCVSWVIFGTSNVAKIPDDKLLIETLLYSKGEGGPNFKSIVRPERVLHVGKNPHYCVYKEGFHHCAPNKKEPRPPYKEIDKIRINHYWSRDEWYLNNVKIPRREIWGTPAETSAHWGKITNEKYDPSILRFVKPLRQKIFCQ